MILPQRRETVASARSYLRAATADLHANLDIRLAPLVKKDEAGYAEFLLRSAVALFPIEQALKDAHVVEILADWPHRSRTSALRMDLLDLSLIEPRTLPVPEVRGKAFQFGMLYVLEGSRLGARLLLREARSVLSPAAQAATRYLSHGQHVPFWPTFLQHLESSHHVRCAPEEAVAGARGIPAIPGCLR